MKYLIILVLAAVCVLSYSQDVSAQLACNDPHCTALIRQNSIDGLEYNLDAPDLWIDREACNDTAISAGWLISASNSEWVEAGVTKGYFENLRGTPMCVTQLSTYYTMNIHLGDDRYRYIEILVPDGRVDVGDNVHVKIQKNDENQISVNVNTPDITGIIPLAQLTLNPNNNYYAEFGIEGTVSAPDEYSSIPMSKYTDIKTLRNGVWNNLPSSAILLSSSENQGYISKKCSNNSFIAGTVTW